MYIFKWSWFVCIRSLFFIAFALRSQHKSIFYLCSIFFILIIIFLILLKNLLVFLSDAKYFFPKTGLPIDMGPTLKK